MGQLITNIDLIYRKLEECKLEMHSFLDNHIADDGTSEYEKNR